MRIIFWGDEFSCLPVLIKRGKIEFYRVDEKYDFKLLEKAYHEYINKSSI